MVAVGSYEVVSHTETPECSLRLIRLGSSRQVDLHYHEKTTQIYFALAGEVEVTINREQRRLQPHQSARVPPFIPHSIRSAGATALVLSISVPPLSRDDQHPVA